MSEPVKEILLPKTLKDLSSHFSVLDIVKQKNPFADITKEQKLIWKYSGGGIVGGRSLDSVIIFLAGPSGAGKSATINALFDDDSLCRTNDATSETEKPSLVSKLLCVKGEQMPVKGNLGFVDVPGTFHTDRESESKNWAIVKKYRDNLPELGYRVFDKTLKALARGKKLRKVVYPNLVLFVVKADNRLQGSDSRLSVSLRALKIHENLVDTKASNLIIVLSHAYSVSPKPKYFNSDIEKMIKNIKEIVEHELGIKDVDVVPVENKPLKYLDEEDKEGDFFPLPNGQLSHGNLFDAMLKRFEANKDHLGKLLVGWYFNPECPERLSQAEESTSFCTYLDKESDGNFEYLALECSNGKKLLVSEGHLIFQFIKEGPEGFVRAKQAKHFKKGELLVYSEGDGVTTPRIERISKEIHAGAYCPLTTSGTFLASGFFVTSYAHVNSIAVADSALLPLKIWSRMKQKLVKKGNEKNEKVNVNGGIHPFGKVLLSVRKSLTAKD